MEWFKIWKIKFLKVPKLCLSDYILINYYFLSRFDLYFISTTITVMTKYFFIGLPSFQSILFFNISYFSRSFSISGYYSTQYGLKLAGLPVEKSTVVEISSKKTLHHLLMNWLTSNPDLLSHFQILRHEKKFAHIFKKQKEFLSSRLNNNFSFLFVYHTLFAYLSLLT